ncbi:MAG: TIGR00730 family Rossman fold protein [Burkholderiales bacterium]|nr:TIGR00730 family Rossman fold protein [Burkholderiales bacterium]
MNTPSQDSPTRRRAIGVFCGAKSGNDPRWVNAAFDLGRALAARGWALVYGGGNVGLMGAVADGTLAGGGEVIGVIPQRLMEREVAHRGLTRLEVVPDMAERKTRMIELSDAFVALPGGLGTLDELFEVLTLAQIGYHRKPVALYNQDGYWDPLLAACRAMTGHGFVHAADLAVLRAADSIDATLAAVAP